MINKKKYNFLYFIGKDIIPDINKILDHQK